MKRFLASACAAACMTVLTSAAVFADSEHEGHGHGDKDPKIASSHRDSDDRETSDKRDGGGCGKPQKSPEPTPVPTPKPPVNSGKPPAPTPAPRTQPPSAPSGSVQPFGGVDAAAVAEAPGLPVTGGHAAVVTTTPARPDQPFAPVAVAFVVAAALFATAFCRSRTRART